ncbi:hypothetical protein D1AOALGA4SA_3338 [Olavius algarvensis Delta 1 endosymbiont]|nr:hypothetical protein D1AOALGA4SA_3338 [Olavius algarvensis Delta 1 endosymbiont]
MYGWTGYNPDCAVQGSTFRVKKTANHFRLIGYYQQHVHKTVSPNG